MFKRKYPALLMSPEDAPYPDYRRVAYTIEGPMRRRLACDSGASVMILHDDGRVTGSPRFDRWEQL
jgi:hypothetical protein